MTTKKLPTAQVRALAELRRHGPLTVTDATEARIRRTFAALVAAGVATVEHATKPSGTKISVYTAVPEQPGA